MARKTSLLLILIVAAAAPALAATRLTYTMSTGATSVYWPQSAFPVPYSVDRRVADAFPGAQQMVDRAFAAWTSVAGASVTFRPAGVADGLQPGANGQNSVSLMDDLYKGQGFIAATTNWYDGSGKLREADIQLDTGLMKSDYNIQLAIEHEVGHLLGLDHSGVLSSVMYPYVSKGGTTALDSDDKVAISALYPGADAHNGATLQGRVIGDRGGIFAAQVVAVNDAGEPVATSLTDANGDFTLRPVPAGNYRIYAEPLDGPVDPRNLDGVWREAKVVSFPTEFLSTTPMRVESGKIYGNLVLNIVGSVRLNPMWVGSAPAGRSDFSLSATTVVLKPGDTVSLAVAGDGFTGGMTKFEVMSPGFRRISDFRYAGNYAFATFTVAADTPSGSVVILVTSGNETATLTGALRVEGGSGGVPRARAIRKT